MHACMAAAEQLLPERGAPWRLALVGANGMLAKSLRALVPGNVVIAGYDLPDCDITRPVQMRAALEAFRPDLVVNCAAFTAVDRCESEEAAAQAVNGMAAGTLATAAADCGALLIHLSTDYVFDGRKGAPYLETDPPAPLSAYGRSKLAGEQAIAASGLERQLIVRTSWLHGPDGSSFVATILRLAGEREELRVVADQIGSPTYTGDLAMALYTLAGAVLRAEREGRRDRYGLYHFANAGQCSWHEFAEAIVAEAGRLGVPLAVQRILPIATADYPLPAPRPAWSVLATQRFRSVTGCTVPEWRDGLIRHLAARYHRAPEQPGP